MIDRAHTGIAALTLLLSVTPAAVRPDEPELLERAGPPEDAVTLTVSGGISLGAYEAGLAWGIIRFLKVTRAGGGQPALLRPRLAAVTGASAGAVNAFIAAALWCERPERDADVDDNLLLDAWLDLDVADILPRSSERYDPGDGLLAAAPLERIGRRIRDAIFGGGATGRFVPGCSVPVGITVTQVEPRRRDVAGLTTSTQRLVVPWRLEVGADGRVTVRRQPLPKGELTESVLDLAGVPGPGEATPFRPEVVEQALLASAAFPLAFAPRRLCAPAAGDDRAGGSAESCNDYMDGGVFDNAPMALAVDLVEGAGGGTVLHPIISFLVDPELRRLRPPSAVREHTEADPRTLGMQLRLFGNLLGTARSAELSRAIRSRGWNRTTERLLRDFSVAMAELAEVHATLARDAATGATQADASPQAPVADRAALGRALSACFDRLAAPAGASDGWHRCARDVPALQLASPSPGAEPLPAGEVVALAGRLAAFLRAERDRSAQVAARAERRGSFQATTSLVATALLFLADEVRRVAASGLPEDQLRRFRDAVLEPLGLSAGFVRETNRLLAELLDAELERLSRAAPRMVAAEARAARGRVAALPEGSLFDLGALDGTTAATAAALARGEWEAGAVVEAWRGVLLAVEVRTRILGLSARLETLRQHAAELVGGPPSEHRLSVPSRFAPLAGSQLSGFAAFLDRPLRRHDYYAGVYEAAHGIAVALCTHEPPESGDAVPVRLHGDPSEIDLTASASQRCVGQAMRSVVEILGVRRSAQARQVVAKLAELELAAWLARSSRAQLLRGEPSWAWLDELAAAEPMAGDPVLAALEALTESRVPCGPFDEEALCPAERTFDEFLAALRAHGYRPSSEDLSLAMRNPALWWAGTLERLAGRALAVERRAVAGDPGPLSDAVMGALSAGELLARRVSARGPTPKLLLDPSTIPGAPLEGQSGWRRAAAHAVPYRLSLDLSRGGFGAAWLEPALHLHPRFSIQSTLEAVGYRSGHGWTSAAGVLVVAHAAGLSVGAGPRWWIDWRGGSGLGVEARLAALQDRLALGLGVRDPGARPGDRGWFVTLSVADLNGLVFWLTPLGRGR